MRSTIFLAARFCRWFQAAHRAIWHSPHWGAEDLDSTLILHFVPEQGGGRIELPEVNVVDHDFAGVSHGWEKYYSDPTAWPISRDNSSPIYIGVPTPKPRGPPPWGCHLSISHPPHSAIPTMASVKLVKLTKIYPGGVTAVDGIDLEIADREFIVLVGPSGCGKTTTLRMIAGLEEIGAPENRIGDRLVNHVPPKDRDIAMVFQNYALIPT